MRHPSRDLFGYCDGALPEPEARAIEQHLASCERCRRERDEILFAASLLHHVNVVRAPDTVWPAIAAELDAPALALRRSSAGPLLRVVSTWPLAAAASLVLLFGAAFYWHVSSPAGPWEVISSGQASRTVTRKAAGDAVETTGPATARIVVGTIGTVDVAPDSRVTLGEASPSTYRLALERGTIRAEINAPPRMFIVDTPASTVVDLGCAYTVTVSPDGTTELHMTSGWSSLEWNGTETLVPAGAMSRTLKGRQPGMPYFEDAPVVLRHAVDVFDGGVTTGVVVRQILDAARVRDTLTLWHLLMRVDVTLRPEVIDRLQSLVPMPARVSREQLLELDEEALQTWRLELAWHW
jgi:hypothetical protein